MRIVSAFPLLIISLVIVVSGCIGGIDVEPLDKPTTQWSQHGFDESSSGQGPHIGPQTNKVLWKSEIGSWGSSVVIGSDGTAYVGTDNGEIYAFNNDGTEKWIFTLPPLELNSSGFLQGFTRGYSSGLAVGSDDTIYVTQGSDPYAALGSLSESRSLIAIDTNGNEKWSFSVGEKDIITHIAMHDNTLYFGAIEDEDTYIYAVNSDGTEKWSKLLNNLVLVSSPAIGSGYLYVGGDKLRALNLENGEIMHEYDIESFSEKFGPSIGTDGTVYVLEYNDSVDNDYLFALNPDLTFKWKLNIGYSEMNPAIASDGTIYVHSQHVADGNQELNAGLHAINPDGTIKWSYEITKKDDEFIEGGDSSPVIGADGTVYFGSDEATIYAIGPDGTEKWTYNIPIDPSFGYYEEFGNRPAIGADGTLYICNSGGAGTSCYAFNDKGSAHISTTPSPAPYTVESNNDIISMARTCRRPPCADENTEIVFNKPTVNLTYASSIQVHITAMNGEQNSSCRRLFLAYRDTSGIWSHITGKRSSHELKTELSLPDLGEYVILGRCYPYNRDARSRRRAIGFVQATYTFQKGALNADSSTNVIFNEPAQQITSATTIPIDVIARLNGENRNCEELSLAYQDSSLTWNEITSRQNRDRLTTELSLPNEGVYTLRGRCSYSSLEYTETYHTIHVNREDNLLKKISPRRWWMTGDFFVHKSHTCAIFGTGGVACWGNNDNGQVTGTMVGNGTFSNDVHYPLGTENNVTDLSAGYGFNCAVADQGTVRCWGNQQNGLGDGTSTKKDDVPVTVKLDNETGPVLKGATQVSVGSNFVCLVANEKVFCWGWNDKGQTGTNLFFPKAAKLVNGLDGVKEIDTGAYHACAIVTNDMYFRAVKCWGGNRRSQLSGPRNTVANPTPKYVMDSNGSVLEGVNSIATGLWHTCALVQGGVKCWGFSTSYDVGQPVNQVYYEEPVDVAELSTHENNGILGLEAGGHHTCVMLEDGVKCWGSHAENRLGRDADPSSQYKALYADEGEINYPYDLALGIASTCTLVKGFVEPTCFGLYNEHN